MSITAIMMKETIDLETVESYFKHLKLFIIELQYAIENIEELSKAQDEGVNLKPTINFLSHYVFISYSHISINFYKIYKPTEKRSFPKLLNKLKHFRYSEDFRRLLISNAFEEDENLIKTKLQLAEIVLEVENEIDRHKVLIEKIFSRRNKFYAHTDPEIQFKPETFSELKELRDLTMKIYNDLYGKIFGKYFMFGGSNAFINEILEDRKFVDAYWRNEEQSLE